LLSVKPLTGRADSSRVAGFIRLAAAAASALIVLGFAMFAADEARRGSDQQVAKIESALQTPDPSGTQEATREAQHGPLREFVDDVNDELLAPFTGVVGGSDAWAKRAVPALLGLLVYGLGLFLLANYLPQRRREIHDWRGAT
jgi:hypothetical protein